MKKLVVCLAVAFVLALVGCAKQPVATDSAAGAQATQAPAVSEPMTQQPVYDAAAEAARTLKRIYFAFDQYTLSAEAKAILEANAAFLKANSGVLITIEGHCDERGSDEYNMALGLKRALAAQNYLTSLGVAPGQLSAISIGEERPLVAGNNEAAWSQNRRAEFVVR
jgi:peptidoglycan-associated lipoprotein